MNHPAENSRDLPTLASEINAEHEAAERAINDSLQHARRCGELLNEAKAKCEHGEWQAWVAENFTSSYRTAAGYMRIAKRWADLPDAKVQGLAHLGVEEALKTLAEPRESDEQVDEDGKGTVTAPESERTEMRDEPDPPSTPSDNAIDLQSEREKRSPLNKLPVAGMTRVPDPREKPVSKVDQLRQMREAQATTPAELTGSARQEFRQSPTGRMHAYVRSLPDTPDFTDPDIAAIEWDPASRDILAMHRDLITRLLNKETDRASA